MAALEAVFEAAPRYFETVFGGAGRRRLGFRQAGEVRPAAPPFVADAVVLEQPLARGGAAG